MLKFVVIFVFLILLTIGGIFLLNPAERLREVRDNQRINDLNNLKKALDFYLANNASEIPNTPSGTALLCNNCATGTVFSFSKLSISSVTTVAKASSYINATGWLPVDFSKNSGLTVPLEVLPVDPLNKNDFVYTFTAGPLAEYKLTAKMESKMGLAKAENDGGDLSDRYEVGTLGLKP